MSRDVPALLARYAAVATTLFLFAACSRSSGPPFSPERALQTFRIEKGFRIELFVSEPQISDPVAMEFDEDGRIYVVEMHGYPLDIGPSGRVKLLRDTDGDGSPNLTTVFADSLVMPTGVMRWKKGVLVTAAPDILYFEDVNGDGRADVKKVVLSGFPFSNPQHTVNSPVYGLDNWIYLAFEGPSRGILFPQFSDPGQALRFPDRSDTAAVDVADRAVRLRPDIYQVEPLSGETQFGHAFDAWGRYFTLDNSNHARHEVIAARYLRRNPDLLVSTAMQNISDHGSNARVYPINRNLRIEMLTEFGEFTSACGMTHYLGGAFPPQFNGVSFVNEPVHNLVHRDVLRDSGSSFVASRARDGVEFLASTDGWFRPVNLTVGPDGALYLVDYYREVIEHPEWTSTPVQLSQNLYNGSDRGRIYRVVPDSTPLPLARNLRLSQASDEELVRHLENPNVWWRRTAQRLLVDRNHVSSVPPLKSLFQQSASAVGRLHALWTLEGLKQLEPALIESALNDAEAGMRENAIRLAELHLKDAPALAVALLKLEKDPSPKVRFQLLCTLGFIDSPASRSAQNQLLLASLEDEWMQIAALSASSDRAVQYFDMAAARRRELTAAESDARRSFLRKVGAIIGTRQKPAEIQKVLQAAASEAQAGTTWWRAASLEGLAEGVNRRKTEGTALKGAQELLFRLFGSHSTPVRRAALSLLQAGNIGDGAAYQRTLTRSLAAAGDRSGDSEQRADAVSFLALVHPHEHFGLLKKLIDAQEPASVQTAAARALGRIPGEEVGAFLISRWRILAGPVRSEAADAVLQDPARFLQILRALKEDEVQAWTLNFSQKRRLLMNRDPKIRDSARAILDEKPGERDAVVKRYQAALTTEGDPARGKRVFQEVCAKCHKLDGIGAEVGPDLGTVRNRPARVLLSDILNPSKSIAQKYEAYVVEQAAGGMSEGVLGSQTPTSITLRQEEGQELVISRSNIRRMYVANLSAMPADLDKQINVQQMADLLKYILGGGD
ncbi:MAG: c-type cytochrome [Acidobacteria bacterium]|nr:c-type cytochrome [Acidobacteriota bacterium]MCI0719801.1 c-type cytochrome [Acidobacteriota bacterium]